MTGYAFGLTTPRDFLEKARREVRRLEEGTERGEDVTYLQDTAINAAQTLWHISDWIARSPEQRCVDAIERIRRERPSQKTVPLLILREHILDNSHMALCEALANGSKHFTLHEPPRFDPSRVLPYDIEIQTRTVAVTMSANVTALAAAGIAPPRYFAKLVIDGTSLPAIEAFKAALAYWDEFFTKYGL